MTKVQELDKIENYEKRLETKSTDERIMERMKGVLQSKIFMVDGRDLLVDSRQFGSSIR